MQKVFVLDKNKQPLMPCRPARAKELLGKRKAAVFRMYPFTIILKNREGGNIQEVEAKIDPGSKVSGIALIGNFSKGRKVLWAANLEHRGQTIRASLDARRALRRGRRSRKTRYRAPRFNNRTRKQGWLPPSLQSRVDNLISWIQRLKKWVPISSIAVETVRFDMQKIQNPEITAVEYSQGELFGYEVREYLLEKWGRKCAYCGKIETRLEIDHIVPVSKGGSDRVSNLTIACKDCNCKKAARPLHEFLQGKPSAYLGIIEKAKTPLHNAAAVNSTRAKLAESLALFNLPYTCSSGGVTKFNRIKQGYPKDHWIDAVCVGETGESVHIPLSMTPLLIKATGRGSRQYCRMDAYGFPRTSAKTQKTVRGFKTGDLVKAIVPKGVKMGVHVGRVAVRSSGNFCIHTKLKKIDGVSHKHCLHVQRSDGYAYFHTKPNREQRFLPVLKNGVSALSIG